MEYVLVILIGIGIIWATYYYSSRAEQKKKAEPEKKAESEKMEASNLIVSVPGVKKPKVEKAKTGGRTQESLDSLYASSHGMWICRYCETLNDGGALQCSACGAKK